MVKVRNYLYGKNEYAGKEIDAPFRDCPCRPCFLIYHFPYRLGNKYIEKWSCVTQYNKGCPERVRPLHIFYLSKKFERRKPGDKFKCLRCGSIVEIGKGDCDWIAVPFRDRKSIIEYLRRK